MTVVTKVLTAADGVSSELRYFITSDPDHLILIYPAMGVPARKYDQLALAFNELGLSAAIAELRGVGSSSVRASRRTDFGYHELISLDFDLALSTLQHDYPRLKISVFGHSLGGQLGALLLAQRQRNHPDDHPNPALILSASCSIYFRGWPWPRNIFILLFTQLGNLIAKLLGYFPGRQLGFGGREAKSLIQDWAKSARSGNYHIKNSHFDYESALQAMKCDVLAINYADDDFSPQSATEKLLDKLSSASIERVMLTAQDLGAKRADHFNWMKHPQRVTATVEAWLEQPG